MPITEGTRSVKRERFRVMAMTTQELLTHIRQLDIKLWLEGERLRYSAPEGAMTAALRADLAAQKGEIIQLLREVQGGAQEPAPPLLPVGRERDLPLSFAQQRLWFLHQLDPSNPVYTIPYMLRLVGAFDIPALERSIQQVVARHETLRTTFPTRDGQPVQIVAPAVDVPLRVVDVRHLAEGERDAAIAQHIAAQVEQPFDLWQDVLLRVSLLRVADEIAVLVLTIHHIISDDWSLDVFFREVAACYEEAAGGNAAELPALPVQYADFAVWQRAWLQGAVLESKLDYWKQHLAGSPALVSFPPDHPRPPVQSTRGGLYRRALPAALMESTTDLSRREGVTLFMTMLSAFAVLLSRFADQPEVLIGSPIANRPRSEVEKLIGFFVNTLVLRLSVGNAATFRALVAHVRDVALAAYAHQDVPFEQVVEALKPERSLSYHPLFQVMFDLRHKQDVPTLALPGVQTDVLPVESGVSQFDLTLFVVETDHGFVGEWEYDTALFDDETIARMAGHFEHLLAGVVANPEVAVGHVPLLTEAERHNILVEWNTTAVPHPTDQPIHYLVAAQAERTPEAVALVSERQHVTYRELNAWANQLAHHLRGLGVGPETLVGLCVDRSVAMVVGVLGILKAGGAYVPLDPSYPQERLTFLLEDTAAPVLLVGGRGAAVSGDNQIVVNLDEWGDIATYPTTAPEVTISPTNLAYVIYTSGSTGKPKGVMVEHRSLVNHSLAVVQAYGLHADDRVLQFASLSFDVSAEELFPTLVCGATVVLRPEHVLAPFAVFHNFLQQEHVTVLNVSASYWHEWVADLVRTTEAVPFSVRLVIVGNEPISPEHLASWQRLVGGGVAWLNAYGLTETTIGATLYRTGEGPAYGLGVSVPIGRPIDNVRAYVLDTHGNPVPVGVAGELYIGGAGVARGYLNRPDLTAERFVDDHLHGEPGGRMYRTGDRVRFLPDGNIEFLGRVDFQVKVRGFRIELAEIEAVLAEHPAVCDVAVVAREERGANGHGYTRLIAYVVPYGVRDVEVNEIRFFLQTRVPGYMVPSAFVLLSTMPRTPAGKVDRKALPEPAAEPTGRGRGDGTPPSPLERLLCDIWAEVLGAEQVGVYDNFFELGGDSILSIQMVAKAYRAGIAISPAQVFQHQSISTLAPVVSVAPVAEAERGPVSGDVPLTPVQRWFFALDVAAPHHWNMPMFVATRHPLAPEVLRQAVAALLTHHDALRMRFVQEGGTWRQYNAPPDTGAIPVTYEDVSGVAAPDQWDVTAQRVAELQASLNLEQGPLVRVALFHYGEPQPDYVLLAIHHLVVDGVSWRILLEDLQTAYHQIAEGEAVALPPRTTSFKRWSEGLLPYAQSDALRQELAYWATLAGVRVARVPLDIADGHQHNTEGSAETLTVALAAEATRQLLADVPARYRAHINDVLLAALGAALKPWLDGPLLVDLEGHGREDIVPGVNLSRTVGWFTTIFPVLLDMTATTTLADGVRTVKASMQRLPQKGIGFGLLRYLADSANGAAVLQDIPAAEISFNYLGQFDQVLSDDALFTLADERVLAWACAPHAQRTHLLEIDASVMGGRLHIAWRYSKQVHRPETVARLAEAFLEALRGLIAGNAQEDAAPAATPADFPLAGVDQATLDALLRRYGRVADLYPLAPWQREMLRQCADAPAHIYVLQWGYRLSGALDVGAFVQAWQQVVARHTTLRTVFALRGETPLQVVRGEVALPWHQEDWREFAPDEQQTRLETWLREDRARGFDLAQGPLLRLALLRLGEAEYELVWSQHHLVHDGWSASLLWQEVLDTYTALRQSESPALEPAPPYRDYVAWVAQQDTAAAAQFWHQAAPDCGPHQRRAAQAADVQEVQRRLSAQTTAALGTLAQQWRLTPGTLALAAWVLALHHLNRTRGHCAMVTTGYTFSTRPPGVRGIETMQGLLIHTLPLCVRVTPDDALRPWLQQLQTQHVAIRQYDYSSLADIRAWWGVAPDDPLFEGVFRFENYPADVWRQWEQRAGLSIIERHMWDIWPYPYSLMVVPGERWLVWLTVDQALVSIAEAEEVVEYICRVFEALLDVDMHANPWALLRCVMGEG